MKKGVHPDYHTITVQKVNGDKYETRSTWGAEGDLYRQDIDPDSHPAWTGGPQRVMEGGRIAKFGERFGKSKFGAVKTESK